MFIICYNSSSSSSSSSSRRMGARLAVHDALAGARPAAAKLAASRAAWQKQGFRA